MKKSQLLESIVKPSDLLKKELINIKGGAASTTPITCGDGKVKCKAGNDNKAVLSVW